MIDIRKILLNDIINYVNEIKPETIEGLVIQLAYAKQLKEEKSLKNIDTIIEKIENKLKKLGIKL